MVMKKNLIITCGTSQIQKYKFSNAVVDDKPALMAYLESITSQKWDETVCDESFLQTDEVITWVEKITQPCLRNWEQRADWVGVKTNILGAEISTLVAMEKEGGDYAWDPETDYFHLIASQSKSGLFAARVAAGIIEKGWKIDPGRIGIRIVEGFNQNSTDPDQAMYNLAAVIKGVLKENEKDDQWQNIFVGSGGFKTSLPLLTVYSFLFGITLVNTYEFSDKLQRLSPRVDMDNAASRKFWNDIWDKLNMKKWMADQTSRYLQLIMEFRVKAKNAKF